MYYFLYMYKKDIGIDIDIGEKCRVNRRVIELCFMNYLDELLDEEQNDFLSVLDMCIFKVYFGF